MEGLRKERFERFILDLQDRITEQLSAIDGKSEFLEDKWERPGGGGGRTRVIQNGEVFEKGGVNTSVVFGDLPKPMQVKFGVEAGKFYACGLSLVLHPENPKIPTVHANWRYFELFDEKDERVDAWYGGGSDLTPYYLFEDDAKHFHQIQKNALDQHDEALYPQFKKACDEYFYNEHRNEGRGIGGTFFDYLRAGEEGLDFYEGMVMDMGKAFLPSYVPIVQKRRDLSFSDEERYFQEIRRGRYVEFNLVHDRGTLFGLKTKGRIESILMSLPPRVRWDYDFQVQPNSAEENLIHCLQNPREWIS